MRSYKNTKLLCPYWKTLYYIVEFLIHQYQSHLTNLQTNHHEFGNNIFVDRQVNNCRRPPPLDSYQHLLQEVRRSTKNITLTFWKDCVMLWEENDRVSGQAVTGFFTTITRHRIHRTLCSNFCDFWIFSKLKMALKGKRFDDIETIQSNATRELKAIPKSAFEDCFKIWKHRWEHVVQSNGDYFEGCYGPVTLKFSKFFNKI